jgi:hypothetical protein
MGSFFHRRVLEVSPHARRQTGIIELGQQTTEQKDAKIKAQYQKTR